MEFEAARGLEAVQPFLDRARELHEHAPAVSLACLSWAARTARELGVPPGGERWAQALDARIATDEAALHGVELQPACTSFAEQLMANASGADFPGNSDLNVAQAFYAASLVLEASRQYARDGAQTDEALAEREMFARCRAQDIRRCAALARSRQLDAAQGTSTPRAQPALAPAPGAGAGVGLLEFVPTDHELAVGQSAVYSTADGLYTTAEVIGVHRDADEAYYTIRVDGNDRGTVGSRLGSLRPRMAAATEPPTACEASNCHSQPVATAAAPAAHAMAPGPHGISIGPHSAGSAPAHWPHGGAHDHLSPIPNAHAPATLAAPRPGEAPAEVREPIPGALPPSADAAVTRGVAKPLSAAAMRSRARGQQGTTGDAPATGDAPGGEWPTANAGLAAGHPASPAPAREEGYHRPPPLVAVAPLSPAGLGTSHLPPSPFGGAPQPHFPAAAHLPASVSSAPSSRAPNAPLACAHSLPPTGLDAMLPSCPAATMGAAGHVPHAPMLSPSPGASVPEPAACNGGGTGSSSLSDIYAVFDAQSEARSAVGAIAFSDRERAIAHLQKALVLLAQIR
ncbi:hypothetical protein KFE25_013469 [Diacronema lutheri]|uniref:Vta1/callose synthase N-terminal domain-containing protein n=1 Tax=Diacronema lutheri TaxID=2081491 RepID=A0A8J5XGF7_DIALT|nr:hypothetical protein KFE25_013469 [Diacronema lutheri]